MIIDDVKLTNNGRKIVTRRCDECGKEEKTRMNVIIVSRNKRNSLIDLCRKCAASRKYKPKSTWKQGKESHLWKNGMTKSKSGIRIYISPKKWIYEHRKVMEEYIGRKLNSTEVVHHINLDSFDNNIDNLYLCKDSQHHGKIHTQIENLGFQQLNKDIWFDHMARKICCVHLISW
jgi:hypothetical protein